MDSWGNKALHSDIKDIGQTLNSFICIWERPIILFYSHKTTK